MSFCVDAGWDTDTMAAINGAIVGAWNGLARIPPRYIDNLENDYKGRDYILSLADRIASRDFGVSKVNPTADLFADYQHNLLFLYRVFRGKPCCDSPPVCKFADLNTWLRMNAQRSLSL